MAAGTTTADADAPPQTLDEEPQLRFRRYAIAFHLVARPLGDEQSAGGGATPHERALESYEDDMLLYAHRDDPPFQTRVVETPIQFVDVHFSAELTYESEGGQTLLRCVGRTERTRRFVVAFCETRFESSGLAVLTVVLTPAAADSELNEYDVIKLVKLWEGGEGVAAASSAITERDDVWFATVPDERTTLHELAARAFPGWEPLAYDEQELSTTARGAYRVGTVELELPAGRASTRLFQDVAALGERREAPRRGARWMRAVALGGILQGLLDFREIGPDELADVYADVDVDAGEETLRAFHKGTLLSLAGEGDEARASPIGVDPYLAVPNIVLLHDEQRLKTARQRERTLSARQRGPLREWQTRAAIGETENGLGEMAALLAQHLPNVFHYASERQLQQRGRESRGLSDLETFMRLRMEDLTSVLQSRVRRRDRWTAVAGIAVGVVTAFLVQQAIQGRPLWLIGVGAAILFAVFFRLRDKLF